MFTGLIQQIGRLTEITFQGDAGRLSLMAKFTAPLQIGESIAINGACLTLVAQQEDLLTFDVLRETFEKTGLRGKPKGAPLNLERALRMGDPLGGHLVSGHVDGIGLLQRITAASRDKVLQVHAPALINEMVPKGSIAIDGVSLTLVEVRSADGVFTVHVIPHTWDNTAFNSLRPGDQVNLETDMLGKYVRQALFNAAQNSAVSWDKLRSAGFLP